MNKSDISNAKQCASVIYGHDGYMSLLVYLAKRVRETRHPNAATHEHVALVQSGRESAVAWLADEIEALANPSVPEAATDSEPAQDPDLSPEHPSATTTTKEDPYNIQ